MRPLEGVSYSRLSQAADQARAASEYLAGHYASRNDLIVGVQAVLDDLVFDPERTDEFDDAIEHSPPTWGSRPSGPSATPTTGRMSCGPSAPRTTWSSSARAAPPQTGSGGPTRRSSPTP